MGSGTARGGRPAWVCLVVVAALAVFCLGAAESLGQGGPGGRPAKGKKGGHQAKGAPGKQGLLLNDPKAFQGYTLVAPLNSKNTYLIDMKGQVVRSWKSDYYPGLIAYLLENGHLLRAGRRSKENFGFGQGRGGNIQEFTWEGELVWDYTYPDEKLLRHHDICKMPNGNVLVIASETKTAKEAAAAGRKDAETFYVDSIVEVQPAGKTGGKIVWEWHVWDHLVQDVDRSKPNYGNVAEHPELLDVNFHGGFIEGLLKKKEELAKLQGLGYVGNVGTGKGGKHRMLDWTHVNSVAYNAELDQVMLSVHEFSELWIIDHGTTSKEAAGHSGGRYGKGGDLLYRWGNPAAYHAGTAKDQQFFFQHDAHWIPRGLPGEGHVLVFNNGHKPSGTTFSSVDEIILPADKQGRYPLKPGAPVAPDRPVWRYLAPNKSDFFSSGMSGAQRLANGDTLVCATTTGTIFEVTPDKEIVWKYVVPSGRSGSSTPVFLTRLGLSPEQTKQLEALQHEVSGKMDKLLSEEQKETLQSMPSAPGGLVGILAGQVLPLRLQYKLKLTTEQRKQLAALDKEAGGKLETILESDQISKLHKMKDKLRGPGAMRAGNKQSIGSAFRAYRYAPNYPGLAGRELTPGRTVEEMEALATKAKGPR